MEEAKWGAKKSQHLIKLQWKYKEVIFTKYRNMVGGKQNVERKKKQ